MNGKSFVSGMGVGAAILALGMTLAGAAQAPATAPAGKAPKEVVLPAEGSFQIVNTQVLNVTNKKGDVVATISGENSGGKVTIFNDSLKPVAIVGVSGVGGSVAVADGNGTERARMRADGTVEVLGTGPDEVLARMAAFKADGKATSMSGRSDFSGQFSSYQKNGVLVDKLPK